MSWIKCLAAALLIDHGLSFTQMNVKEGSISSLVGGLLKLQERTRGASLAEESSKRKKKCQICPDTERDDPDMDRREAAFAMAGSLWAMGSAAFLLQPEAAQAAYGADAKIELPNVVEGLTLRATQQCLVETLGNRECLVYLDPANKLYQGADSQVLLERIEKASVALASIPELVESKKWSKITGVLTGPVGTLLVTMGQLSNLSDNSKASNDMAKLVKTDIFAIGAAADRKDGDKTLGFHKQATEHLVAFVQSL